MGVTANFELATSLQKGDSAVVVFGLPHHKVGDAASPRLQPSPCCVTTALANATAVMYVFD